MDGDRRSDVRLYGWVMRTGLSLWVIAAPLLVAYQLTGGSKRDPGWSWGLASRAP